MSSRIRPINRWLWCVAVAVLSAGPVAAQPPSPLELVRGLRENGQVDLALEYLKELEGKPLSDNDKAAILLERAKCLLDASEDEADEGTRLGMIAEAKEGLSTFVLRHPNHPRAVEGLLSSAKLTSLDAKELLSRARKMDVPPKGDPEREAAAKKQFAEASKARPVFLEASSQFAKASGILRTRLEDKTLDVNTRRNLEREAFEADLASGINQFSIAETFTPDDALGGPQKELRNKFLEQSKEIFGKLAKGSDTNRTKWVARAWVAEVMYEQDKLNDASAEVALILKAGVIEAEDGKRLARFFQLRRNVRAALNSGVAKDIAASETEMRRWLAQYGNPRKPTPEVFAVRYYLARTLHFVAEASTPVSKDPAKPTPLGGTAYKQMEEAEKIYRGLAQSDNEYTSRASRYRMAAVRRLLEASDQNPLSYVSFEKAQMASLIQLSRLLTAEAKEAKLLADAKTDQAQLDAVQKDIKDARLKVIALLERSRELATPQDNPADVVDVFLRLIYFYQQNEQFYQAAVLGDYVARTIKSTGGKAAIAGLLGLNGYVDASKRVKGDDLEARAAARQADRDRAIALGRFLDEKYPNDNATDAARYRLASLYIEEKRLMEAYEVLVKVRPGYAKITDVRLSQGYVVSQLVAPLDSKLSKEDKTRLFRRAVSDLAKVPKPITAASEDEVRGYLSARCRLASMMFAQDRADPETEKTNAGFNQALGLAEEVLSQVATFDCMVETKDGMKKLNIDGMEMNFLALDTYSRALYLRARRMIQNNQLNEAGALIQPTLDGVQKDGALFNAEMKAWAAGAGSDEPDAKQKARIGKLAEAVDKNRVDVILAGFRVRVQQSKAAEATALLDLMVKAGGSVEESLPMLEPVGRELAAQLTLLRKEGKEKEAKDLAAGLAVLLDKIRTAKNLPASSVLFIGQTLQTVGENEKALEMLKKVPQPKFAGWETLTPDKMPADKPELPSQIRDYALAQLSIARAQRGLKKFAEAEAMLKAIVGTRDKPGWGAGRLYFRKELAELYETKGAAEPDTKKATAEWSLALQEWTNMLSLHRSRLTNLPKEATQDQIVQYRNAYAEAFFDVYRCEVVANKQLLEKSPDKLQKSYDKVGKLFADMEKQIPAAEWQPEVHNRYTDLLKTTPPLMATYKANGGKLFLEKLPPRP